MKMKTVKLIKFLYSLY